MSLEILSELNQIIDFLPKFDVAIGTECNNKISFGCGDDVINSFPMHVAKLV